MVQEIERPGRWDRPFSESMTDADVDGLLLKPPFSRLDAGRFRGKFTLAGILKNDARLFRASPGELIIREGDWGNSVFFLLSGSVRIVIEPGRNAMPAAALGMASVARKSFLEAIRQLWSRPADSEVRDRNSYLLTSRHDGHEDTPIFLQDVPVVLQKYQTVRIEAQQSEFTLFGEQSALGRMERTANVFADSNCELLEIRWQGLRDIMQKDPGLKQQIDDSFREHGLRAFLRSSPFFSHIYADSRDDAIAGDLRAQQQLRLINETEFATYGNYDKPDNFKKLVEDGTATGLKHETIIAKEGDHPNGVILIRSGLARVSHEYHHGHRTVSYLTPGQAFGIEEIVAGFQKHEPVPLKYSVRAVGYVTAVIIPTRLFEELVLQEIQSAADAPEVLTVQESGSDGSRAMDVDTGLLEFLVERRYINGTQTMVIDMDRCTRCDDCVRACAATHDNNPRFLRNGPMHGKYMVANACMHCADPVCMIKCPTGAIHRNQLGGQVVINDQTCIGCQACANNCSYDAIRMVQIRDHQGVLFHDSDSKFKTIEKATKCDLCADQLTGPACQNACPHDALVRLNLGDHESVADWVNR